jgi:hypothetical protein
MKIFLFSFIVVLDGGTLWYFKKFFQCIKYIILEFITLLHASTPHSWNSFNRYQMFCTIFILLPFPTTSLLPLVPAPSSLGRTCSTLLFSNFVEGKPRRLKKKHKLWLHFWKDVEVCLLFLLKKICEVFAFFLNLKLLNFYWQKYVALYLNILKVTLRIPNIKCWSIGLLIIILSNFCNIFLEQWTLPDLLIMAK